MNAAGMLFIAGILGAGWSVAVYAQWLGRKRSRKNAKAIEKDTQAYLSKNLGNGIIGDLYRGGLRMDAAIERSTRPIDNFVALCQCPKCEVFAVHYIDGTTNHNVMRKCINPQCKKRWRQRK
jgi:hypothetical protein